MPPPPPKPLSGVAVGVVFSDSEKTTFLDSFLELFLLILRKGRSWKLSTCI
jgi:hypothetical protein